MDSAGDPPSATGDSPAPPSAGTPAPDVVIETTSGQRVRLAELRGTPVVLCFSAPHWNPARSTQIASYNALVHRIPDAGAARLLTVGEDDGVWRALTFDTDTVALPFFERTSCARNAALASAFGVAGMSAVFVIDAAGIVRWRHVDTIDSLATPDLLSDALAALGPMASTPSEAVPTADATRRPDWQAMAPTGPELSRRGFVAVALAASLALLIDGRPAHAAAIAPDASAAPAAELPRRVPVTLSVNGRDITLDIEPRVTLLDALRERAGLTGSKKGCDHGQCGACTVHTDGRRTLSCLTLAVMAQGKAITTIEGLAGPADALHPVQQAFLEHDGFQCGYCTPGQIMSAVAVLREPGGTTDDDVREAMSGNCRCGAYPGIVAAVQDARKHVSGAR